MTGALAPTLKLRRGARIPLLGLGTWPLDDAQTAAAVITAVDAGYRLFDTAENYRNERGVGEGIRRSGIERGEVFLTTKFNKEWHSRDGAKRAFEKSARRLGVDYIDLLLLHWPNPEQDRYVDAVAGLADLFADGRLRAIGTSNFKAHHLQRLIDAGLVPDLNQIQLDPRHARSEVRAVHRQHGIVTESWSPLGQGSGLLESGPIAGLAAKYGRAPAQIVLRWHVQQGLVAIPKSATPERIHQNISIFDFELDDDDMAQLRGLDAGEDGVADSDRFGH
ncbi:aldo/keto reductase [Paenarthrobacter sp. Z7-10]|uniref:aldo/keto reductase n=1 Tax=Paenarthrobacter sp. Z7-10 TaxID=2787635 RepID=UPI0022A8DD3B|nr:aldo/keto reductase [Paenarthrobacter sp. Z7-10]MCZ2404224.1 aldo/keto reductase [Paenarthrobacter sp. Z7-10]